MLETELEHRLTYYENSNSPPSSDLLHKLRREKQKQNSENTPTKRGAKQGHIGISHNRQSTKTIRYKSECCSHCSSKNIVQQSQQTKQVYEIPKLPKAQITTHIIPQYICDDCNNITTPKTSLTEGTDFGPNVLSFLTQEWNNRVPLTRIKDLVQDLFDIKCTTSTIYNTLQSVSKKLEKPTLEIKQDIQNTDNVHYDETGNRIDGKNGWTWISSHTKFYIYPLWV